ncbi:MAG: leucyl aminopeptidase, partial [Solirubrobacteraceae bacterium]|nr:leucyl aminopeptidase [Solirubrobacteraceae bacterium]
MLTESTTALPADTDADTVVLGVLEGERIAHDVGGALQGLIDAGEAKASHRHLAVTHAAGKRWVLVGLGARAELDGERVRIAAASALGRARELGARRLCWEVPHKVGPEIAAAIVEGTLLCAYRFDRFKAAPSEERVDVDALIVSAHDDLAGVVEEASIVAQAVNFTRDLQNAPPNEMAPRHLAEAARELAELDGVTCEVAGRDGIVMRGMGAFAAVAQGSYEEPALITLRYEGPDAAGPVLGLVGKAVTFDTGGISIKPANKMFEMKFDMSGGAAVLGAVEAIARLALPVRLVAVVGATENMPSGRAMRPGDVVRASNGVTIEIINTDAEGRLLLADALHYARTSGATHIVDFATLTGAMTVALGDLYAGWFCNDDAFAAEIDAASSTSGDLAWRFPLHPRYRRYVDSDFADM